MKIDDLVGAARNGDIAEKISSRKATELEEACRQFEGIFLGMLWKDMMRQARSMGGHDEKRPFGVLEDLSVEMAAESLTRGEGIGLWRILYEQLKDALPQEKAADA